MVAANRSRSSSLKPRRGENISDRAPCDTEPVVTPIRSSSSRTTILPPKTPMDPVSVEGSATMSSPPDAAASPIDTTTGLPASRTRHTSRQIVSEATAEPPGESMCRTTARTCSSLVAARRDAPIESLPTWRPIGPRRGRPDAITPRTSMRATWPRLRAATNDEHVRAVVLHIDSPGGSAVASDTIWREVCRVREAGKPVVVSMGEAAASGGYYIACPADVIVALPSTLTGSIGVFGGKMVVRELLDRIGLTTGSVSQGARSLMFSPRRGFSDDERERFAATIDAIYVDFVAKVAQGRGRPVAEIEAIARGRVWTGSDALGIGLVDELGGLRDAIRIARLRAGLSVDAPVLRALHVGPLARLGRAKNTEDPRAVVSSMLPDLSDVAAALGMPASSALRMPSITVR